MIKQVLPPVAVMLLVFCCLFYLSGCSPAAMAAGGTVAAAGVGYIVHKELQNVGPTILHAAGYEATVLALRAINSPKVANGVVTASNDALKYLQSGELPTADIVNQTITAFYKDIDPVLLAELQAIAATVGKYVPSASVVLTADQIGYLVALIQGIRDGANSWIADNTVTVKPKYTIAKPGKLKAVRAGDVISNPWFSVKQ